MTPSNAPAADKCQCPKAKADYEIEGELGTTVICPDCHLEEATSREPDNAEQADFISNDAAKRRFPDLFPEEQVSNCEEGQETVTRYPSTKEIEPLDGEGNQSNEAAGDFGGNHSFPNLGEPAIY
jgi:ssDNA-binding Zn-finger/Zn-ribbon topoisomerase 1